MRASCIKLLASIGAFASLCLSAATADAFLAGNKNMGMGAAGIAYPQDAYAGAYNPAGIVDVCDRLDAGPFWVQDRGHSVVRGNQSGIPGVNGKFDAFVTKDVYGACFGLNKNYCSEICGNCWNWATGLVVYNGDYQKTKYPVPAPLLGTSNLGLEYLHEVISVPFGLRINDRNSIGVSIDVHGHRLKVQGLQNFDVPFAVHPPLQVPTGTLFPGHVTNRGYNYAWGVNVTLGWKWQALDCLAVGVIYRPRVTMNKLHKYKGFEAQHGKVDIPEEIGVGLAYQWLSCSTIIVDFTWRNWHDVKALHNPLLNHTVIPGTPINGTANALGASNGPGFGFRNQYKVKAGIDYNLWDCLTLRAGYAFVRTPIRSTQTAVNLLTCDTIENYFTVGASYLINPCNEISIFFAHGFRHKIKGHNSIPVWLGSGEVDLEETGKDALGISWGWLF